MSGFVDREGAVRESIIDTLPDAEALLARRADVVKRLRTLRAKYGGQGFFGERTFKLEEAKIDTAVRAQFRASQKAGDRPATEGAIDATVRQHPNYIAALMAAIEEKATWVELEEELASIDWRLRLRSSDSYLLGSEARLTT